MYLLTNATTLWAKKWPILVVLFSVMKAPGNDVCAPFVATKINWTRLRVVITHVTLDFSARIHTLSARLHLIMEKLSRRWRSCLVSACGTRLVNNRLSETCAHHRLKPVRRAGLTNCLPNRDVSLNYSQTRSWEQQNGAKLLNRGGFDNCPHSVQHQPGRAVNLMRK